MGHTIARDVSTPTTPVRNVVYLPSILIRPCRTNNRDPRTHVVFIECFYFDDS